MVHLTILMLNTESNLITPASISTIFVHEKLNLDNYPASRGFRFLARCAHNLQTIGKNNK